MSGVDHMAKIKIILADDHAVLRAGLKLLLNNEPDFTVAGEAADGQQVLRLLERETADVLILDLAMPVMGGWKSSGSSRAVAAR